VRIVGMQHYRHIFIGSVISCDYCRLPAITCFVLVGAPESPDGEGGAVEGDACGLLQRAAGPLH